jgi:hypothetical protein
MYSQTLTNLIYIKLTIRLYYIQQKSIRIDFFHRTIELSLKPVFI